MGSPGKGARLELNEALNSNQAPFPAFVLDYDDAGALVGIDVQHASQKADIHHLAISHMPLTMLEAA